jgi:uncharacterized protein YndB with AHSA1/START domain
MEMHMPYSYVLTAVIPATAEEIYHAWLDSTAHSKMTGGEATMSDRVGAEVSAWDSYITGRNLALVPSRRIVQSWRTSNFTDAHEDSIITVTLQNVSDGTLLTLEHKNVPDDQRSYEEGGWQSNYFEPMAVYFAERRQTTSKKASKRGRAAATKSKRATKKTQPRMRKNKKKSRGKIAARKTRRGKRRSIRPANVGARSTSR